MPLAEKNKTWLVLLFALLLLGGFFLLWVNWENITVPGYAMPSGDFFAQSARHFGLDNPYPGLNILLKSFWLIPIGALAALILAVAGKNTTTAAAITGVMALTLVTVYILFTRTL